MGFSRQAFRSIPGSVGDVRRNAPGLGAGEQAPPLPRCHPLVPSLQPQAETRIIDVQIPVRAAQNRLGLHRRDFLRHDPNIGRVAPQVPIAIEIDAAVDFSDLSDIALQANVGYRAAAALRELEAASECSNLLFVEYVPKVTSDISSS